MKYEKMIKDTNVIIKEVEKMINHYGRSLDSSNSNDNANYIDIDIDFLTYLMRNNDIDKTFLIELAHSIYWFDTKNQRFIIYV